MSLLKIKATDDEIWLPSFLLYHNNNKHCKTLRARTFWRSRRTLPVDFVNGHNSQKKKKKWKSYPRNISVTVLLVNFKQPSKKQHDDSIDTRVNHAFHLLFVAPAMGDLGVQVSVRSSFRQHLPWMSCERNSSYSFVPIILKLCMYFLHDMKICMGFWYNC